MSQIEETLSGLRIIKAFNAERKISDRFHKSNEDFRQTTNRIFRRQQLAHPMSEFLGVITIVIILWYGGTLIISDHGTFDAPAFIYYLTIFYLLINPVKDLFKSVYSIQKGLASMNRCRYNLECSIGYYRPDASITTLLFNRKIVYRDVWFKYKDNWIIQCIDLEILKGKTVALVGQSGPGKSTRVDLLPRSYDVLQGAITIDDTDIRGFRLTNLRRLMGIVNQEAILFIDTFFNNIAFGSEHATFWSK